MFINHKNNKKNWFTLVEVLFVCSIFAIIVTWIILAVNRSYVFMNNTKLEIRAANFAREWVEMMFNIRDTNWRMHSWEKDKYRIKIDPVSTDSLDSSQVFFDGIYALKEVSSAWQGKYIKAELLSNGKNDNWVNNFYSDEFRDDDNDKRTKRNKARIELEGEYPYIKEEDWEVKIEMWEIENLLWNETDFYRIVRVYGVYKKDSEEGNWKINKSSLLLKSLTDSSPKELRFCVKVFYRNLSTPHSTELCSIMTNFME